MFKSKKKSKKSKKNSKKQNKQATPTLSLKEKLAQKRQAAKAKKELTSLLTTAISGGVFLGIILFFVAGIKLAIPGVAGVIVLALSYKYPRQALFAFIIYVPFGGTIIYLLGNSPILQLAKDAFYIPAVIALYQQCKKQKMPFLLPKGIKTPFLILFSLCIVTLVFANGMQQINPPPPKLFAPPVKEMPLGMGILGLKVFLGYFPLITCAYYLIRNKRDFLFISRLQVVLILICCILGFLQYMLLVVGICEGTRNAVGDALFKATLDARCFIGGSLVFSPSQGMIRLPGTFVAPWQWAWFLISSTFFTFATGFNDPSILWRIISLVSLGTVLVNAVVSGQRIALALVPACFVLLLVLTGQLKRLKAFLPLFILLFLVIFGAIASNPGVIEERLDSFISRWNASPPYEFITQQFEESWHFLQKKGEYVGKGLGRATNSARVLGKTQLIETYYPKLIYEIGPLGALGFLVFATSLTIISFRTYRSIKNRNFRGYGAALWVFILFISYNTYYYPLDVDPVAVYYWFFAGVLFKLPEIDKIEQLKEEQNQEAENKRGKRKPRVKKK
ncbi:MAG: hormogonium polysaccharide biosynthesis protein HpsL [Cyanobacteria bacterium P01_A01_bin.84]